RRIGAFAQIAVTGPGVVSYTDVDLADVTTYCYQVRAFNTAGYSAYTNQACATTGYALTVTAAGAGSGTVTSSPAGIRCEATCMASYASGTVVTLTATPAAGSVFTGWSSGSCTGSGTCVVTLSATTTVTATFSLQTFGLAVSKAGTGSGAVT